jgi:hypothetical protein
MCRSLILGRLIGRSFLSGDGEIKEGRVFDNLDNHNFVRSVLNASVFESMRMELHFFNLLKKCTPRMRGYPFRRSDFW